MITRTPLLLAFLGLISGPIVVVAAVLSPLVVDSARYLAVDWQESKKGSRTLVTGTVRTTGDWGARRIQLLIEGLDPNGQVVSQRVVWLGSDLSPGSHVYFEVPVTEPAPSYRVRVFAFDPAKRP